MSDIQTCGQGLAEHSVLPGTLAGVTEAMAEVLAHHRTSLEQTDPNTRAEHMAYTTLASELRSAAATLRGAAERMAADRNLPMGRHDASVLGSPPVIEKFERFVQAERDLLHLLQASIERDETILEAMRAV